MTSALAVAHAFLDIADSEGKSLTNMQLQKLVFFAHGIHLAAFNGVPLIEDPIKAWDFGPVIPPLYEKLRKFGRGVVTPGFAIGTHETINPDGPEMQAIKAVWKAYKDYNAWQLSDISHREGSPWFKVWNELGRYRNIPNDMIHEYYAGRIVRKD